MAQRAWLEDWLSRCHTPLPRHFCAAKLLRTVPTSFQTSWNFVDAYLKLVYGPTSQRYLTLRQALMARRCLLLLDGVDEGGDGKEAIEAHIVEVLMPQGFAIVATSRPDGVQRDRWTRFVQLQLRPLSLDDQRRVIRQRLQGSRAESVVNFVSASAATKSERTVDTSSPLMLSMVRASLTDRSVWLRLLARYPLGTHIPHDLLTDEQVITSSYLPCCAMIR